MNLSLLSSLHVFALLVFHSQASNLSFSSPTPSCHPEESSALLRFKASFSSFPRAWWNESSNCCQWHGIKCDGVNGQVVELDLSNSRLNGTISSNSSLFSLRHLQILRLSGNEFRGSYVSPLFGLFNDLTELDISNSNFGGDVPREIARLSKLSYFSILNYLDQERISIGEDTMRAMAMNLTQLKILALLHVDMSAVNSFSSMLNLSSSLMFLSMGYCGLHGELPETLFGNFRELRYLSLVGNNLRGRFSWSSLNFEHLYQIDLSNNDFSGRIPEIYVNSSSSKLLYFSLKNNSFEGMIPSWIFKQPSLLLLDLSDNHFTEALYHEFSSSSMSYLSVAENKLHGQIPNSIFQNVKLKLLDLSSNNFTGDLEIEKISKLKDLTSLSLSSNNFSLNFRSSKNISLDNMEILDLSYCDINFESSINISLNNLTILNLPFCNIKEFPNFLKSLKRVEFLDLSQNSIQGNVPKWFMEVGKDSLSMLNLSHNLLTHIESFSHNSLQTLDLRSNLFSVPFPDLSLAPRLGFILLSKNHFVGNIPVAFCSLSSLNLLDLSHNNLSGKIPRCITNSSSSLTVLDLRMNNLHGSITSTFATGCSLRTLNLNGNQLEGSLHQSLLNCKMLEVLDIGGNNVNGPFPQWLESLPELQVLILRGNTFYGPIGSPMTRFSFQKLRIMDLSNNKFTGSLPKKFFENLSAMMDSHRNVLEYMGSGYYQDSVAVVMKGSEFQLERIITIFTTIDLSSNDFKGGIPSSIGNLKSVKGRNLSHNNLGGHIPISLGNLSNIEWLDLSSNKLNGEIPNKLAEDLTQLSFLNLSINALVGPIPRGKQFNTFEKNSYIDNLGLCGPPLSKTCSEAEGKVKQQYLTSTKHEDVGLDWKVVMLIGYGGGLVFGVSMGFVIIHDTTVYRIMEIVNWRNQGSLKKLNGRKIRRAQRGRN